MSAQKTRCARARVVEKRAVFYELYPRSFADSNNDGVGDLNGNYFEDGLTWRDPGSGLPSGFPPCFPSPQVGLSATDVSDYENIDPMYGTPERL